MNLAAAAAGHEIGLHAWDHHRWQTGIEGMTQEAVAAAMECGLFALSGILGRAVACAVVPGWQMTDGALGAAESLYLRYSSDCRGGSLVLLVERAGELDYGVARARPSERLLTVARAGEVLREDRGHAVLVAAADEYARWQAFLPTPVSLDRNGPHGYVLVIY